jgi:hypothetical protein
MRSKAIGRFLGVLGGLVLATAPASSYGSTILNLTTTGATATSTADIGGSFTVTQISPQSTGTGVIDSFLRVQANGNERGYNTDLGTPLDDKGGGFTRSLLLSEVPTVDLNGTPGNLADDYYQFLLDINQVGSGINNLLSLSQIQIFQASADQLHTSITEATDPAGPNNGTSALIAFGSATEVFRMSSTAANAFTSIELDYNLNPGSGAGDMFLYVRKAAFSSDVTLDQVILFSQFGIPNGTADTNDGFEEWAVLKSSLQPCLTCNLDAVPEPASLLLLGSGISLVAAKLRRRKARLA